ncbi:MAG TPA: hypothetical protein PLK76_04000 [bacterium]|nr:hypothetical protein [bacterium]
MKPTKKILSIIFLILVILALGAYFLFFNHGNLSEQETDSFLNFKNYDTTLAPEILAKYSSDFEKAKQDILEKTDEFNTSKWLSIARLKKYVKDYAGAEEIYLMVIEKDPNNYIPEANLADLYGNYLKDWQKAADHYWQAVNKTGLNFSTGFLFYTNLADIYAFNLKDQANVFETKALAALEKGYVNNVDFLTLMARFYKNTDNKIKAIEFLEKALVLNPANREAILQEIEMLK